MVAEMVVANLFTSVITLIIFLLMSIFLWKLFRSLLRRNEMIDAYFTAKLKKHATKFDIDLNTEMAETRAFTFWELNARTRKEAKQRRLNTSCIAETDLLFEALDEKEVKGK